MADRITANLPSRDFDATIAFGLSADACDIPRLTGLVAHPDAPRMFALVDPDGSLLRVIDNEDE